LRFLAFAPDALSQSTFGTVSSGGGGSSTYNVGGSYRGGESYSTPASSFGTAQGPYGNPSTTAASSSLVPQPSGEYESKVVEAATQPTGVRAMPSRFRRAALSQLSVAVLPHRITIIF
jgi:hypothetical protein